MAAGLESKWCWDGREWGGSGSDGGLGGVRLELGRALARLGWAGLVQLWVSSSPVAGTGTQHTLPQEAPRLHEPWGVQSPH